MRHKRHTRAHVRHHLIRHGQRGARDAVTHGYLDREDLEAGEFLASQRQLRVPSITRSCTLHWDDEGNYLGSSVVRTPFKGTALEYALSKDGKLGKRIHAFFAQRSSRPWGEWRSGYLKWQDRQQNRARRDMADRALLHDPEAHDPYQPVRNWLS